MSAPVWIVNARLLDPDSGYDGPGAVRVEDGRIAEQGDHASLVADGGIYARLCEMSLLG